MTETNQVARQNRRVLFVMIGLLLFVLISSTALYRAAVTGVIDLPSLLGTSNRGELLQPPLAFDEFAAEREIGTPLDYSALDRKWSLIIPAQQACKERCEQNLYLTRQVRILLGKDMGRVRRFLLTDASLVDAELREYLRREHADLEVLHTSTAALERLKARVANTIPEPSYFIVDPEGWVMMAYRQDQNPKDLLADLKFLLKYSNEHQGE